MDVKYFTFCVVGMGLIGGSYAKRLKELGARVVAVNRSAAPLEAALAESAIDAAGVEHLREADIVIFAVPEDVTEAFVRTHAGDFKKGAVLTDAAGVKEGRAPVIQSLLPAGADFISAHPMAGREGGGYGQSDGRIFVGCNYILVPQKENAPAHVALIREMALALGSRSVPEVTAEDHDRIIAYTSDLPHAAAAALVASPSLDGETHRFIGGGFRDATRIADINGPLWTKLFLANRDNLLREIARYRAALDELNDLLERKDEKGLALYLERAGERRRMAVYGKDPGESGT